ncbi:hypothetical protein EV361DRAFT_947181 [Lentinula raphanica]|nr:hypothetical protein EV361DRAFT_947181 [Lentinula raphanica]
MPLVHVVTRLIRVLSSSLFSLPRFSILCFAVCMINSVAVIAPPIDQEPQESTRYWFDHEEPIYLSTVDFPKGKIEMKLPSFSIAGHYFGDPAAPKPSHGEKIGTAYFTAHIMDNWASFWASTHEAFAKRFSVPDPHPPESAAKPDPRPYEGSIDYWRALDDVMEHLHKTGVISDQAIEGWKETLNSALTLEEGETISLVIYHRVSQGHRREHTGEVSLLVGDAGKIISPIHDSLITAENRAPKLYPIGTLAERVHINALLLDHTVSNSNRRFRGKPEDVAKWEKAEADFAPKRNKIGPPATKEYFKEWKWADRLVETRPYFSEKSQEEFDQVKTVSLEGLIDYLEKRQKVNSARTKAQAGASAKWQQAHPKPGSASRRRGKGSWSTKSRGSVEEELARVAIRGDTFGTHEGSALLVRFGRPRYTLSFHF